MRSGPTCSGRVQWADEQAQPAPLEQSQSYANTEIEEHAEENEARETSDGATPGVVSGVAGADLLDLNAPPRISLSPSPIRHFFSSSPPPPEPRYDLEIQYTLRVNKRKEVEDSGTIPRRDFSMSIVEDKVEALIVSEACSIQGRPYDWVARQVSYKVEHLKASWVKLSLTDFDISEDFRLVESIDDHLKRYNKPVARVAVRLEVSIKVDGLQKAFKAVTANEPSSEPDKDLSTPYRTKQLLREARTLSRVEEITASIDHQSAIHKMWECREETCSNYKYWCYSPHPTEHYAIHHVDIKSWGRSCLEGQSSVHGPHPRIVEALRVRGNQLHVNPNNKWKKRKRGASLSSSDSGLRLGDILKTQQKMMAGQLMS
ncbi:uncharacterized protein EI97DRAFT_430303 [Westerdykella ornata]|uniref:Uncharacterized protein n=1 Tax=Westerdykella ornata TaxID=318751 RepID=A0A6A6JRF2_WESOR|nr:uncharacterized protein EI97DRAFT_430303 [Westerdykella ornata]KAF2279210.1 hypothetical protein EI97DRAFT_430303 [Westerdykella ornata]